MIVLIDLDGTVRNTYARYVQYAQYVASDIDWPENGPEDYLFLDRLNKHPKINQLHNVWQRPGLFEFADPYPDAVESVKKLIWSDDYRVFFVTQPYCDTAAAENMRWVDYHFGMGSHQLLIQTFDRTLLQADVLIDDKPIIKGAVEFPVWKHIIYDQPYNRKDKRYADRLLNWRKLNDVLNSIRDSR